jgi:hypothetical protein
MRDDYVLRDIVDYLPFRTMSSIRAPTLFLSANARSRTRHSIDAFHQPHWKAKESTAKCIIASRVLPPSAAGSLALLDRPVFKVTGEQGTALDPIQRTTPHLRKSL